MQVLPSLTRFLCTCSPKPPEAESGGPFVPGNSFNLGGKFVAEEGVVLSHREGNRVVDVKSRVEEGPGSVLPADVYTWWGYWQNSHQDFCVRVLLVLAGRRQTLSGPSVCVATLGAPKCNRGDFGLPTLLSLVKPEMTGPNTPN